MSAFEGTADPLEAIESGYYVNAPGKLLVDQISGRVALRPFSSHLLIGGIGSGKTTQLLVARQQINEIEDTHAIYVDVSLHTDISKISNGVLTAIAGVQLAELMAQTDSEQVKQCIELIFDLAFGYTKETDISSSISQIAALSTLGSWKTKYEGIIPNISDKYGIKSKLVEVVTELAEAASKEYGHIVFLFDGLDRLDNAETFMQIVSSDAKAISSAGIGLVLVGPLVSLYSEYRDMVDDRLDYFYYQPFFDVENDPEAYNFFKKILLYRSSENFIQEFATHSLIYFSGGVLRDFISLTQASIEETYLSGEDKLQEKHVLRAIDSFSRSQLLGLSDNDLKTLKVTLNTGNFVPRTEEDIRLIIRRLILEYSYPTRRYAVHPAIKSLVEHI
ncbi:hypothetical protein [Anabaena sp. UHCC 0399]|uniref:hypothetical protein n=1 Tax=Anabaena sp. UHCC 0399 TaxID=3110238 RepID=UPI002B202FB4|nr:hypothetical protein [Anabaena sp. UHCC 0399]MEA5568380.1 hypothetical protein [Anabaena sp. UHCC 0399]